LLETLLKDKVLEVRNAAAVALGPTGNAASIPAISKLLLDKPSEDNEFARRAAARSIGQIAQIIRTGKIEVITPQNFLPDKYKNVEAPSARDLPANDRNFPAAAAILVTVLRNSAEADDTRREAAFALGAIGNKLAVTALESGGASTDPYLAEICREATLKIGKLSKPN